MKKLPYLLLISLLSFFACDKEEKTDTSEPITLGAVYNLTGGQATLDTPSSKGAQLAIQQVNDSGGVHNKMVELILKDGQTSPAVLKEKVAEILEEAPATAAFLGLSDTDQVLAAAGVAADNERVFMTSGATSPQLPGQIPDYLFMACFGDNVQAAAAAEYAYDELGARTVSVVYDSSDTYTRLLQGYFITRFEELGGAIVSKEAFAQGNMSPAIQNIQSADFVFYAALPQDVLEGIQLIRQAGIDIPVIGGDSYDEPSVWENQTDLGAVYFTTHASITADNNDPRVQAFRTAYIEQYNGEEPNSFAALGYDAAQLLIEAIQRSSNATPAEVLQHLSSIENFEGISGTISYKEGSRIPHKSVTMMSVNGGKQEFVLNIIPKVVPAP